MSQINVNNIKNRAGTGAPTLGNGVVVTGVVTATTGAFSGNVSIGGTLTYEDVTNIDSVGVVTARLGVNVTGGEIAVGAAFSVGQAGVVTATSFVGDGSNLIGVASTENIITGTAATFTSTVDITTLRATDNEGNFILDSYLFN